MHIAQQHYTFLIIKTHPSCIDVALQGLKQIDVSNISIKTS